MFTAIALTAACLAGCYPEKNDPAEGESRPSRTLSHVAKSENLLDIDDYYKK